MNPGKEKNITEDFLHHIWKYRLYKIPLTDMDGEVVEILDPGQHNHDAGPDFFDARIRVGGIIWAGNVELHLKASDWYLHGHHHDPAYSNVILHIVLEADCIVNNWRMQVVPTACIDFNPEIYTRYSGLIRQRSNIHFQGKLSQAELKGMKIWMEGLIFERLYEKLESVRKSLKDTGGNWEEVLYRFMARAFGQHVNAMPFEMLSRSMPLALLQRYRGNLSLLEALFFGQAGLLPVEAEDSYSRELIDLYRYFRKGYKLQPLEGHLWKFLRLRPMNFPGVRISQLAFLLHLDTDVFGPIIRGKNSLDFIRDLDIRTSRYWEDHYILGKLSRKCTKKPGKDFIQRLVINAALPVRFAYEINIGKNTGLLHWADILHEMEAEDNHTVRTWKALGLPVPDAFSSQALLQLTNKYCIFKRCLSCYVGNQIIQSTCTER